jgi:SNF2 family DNA or RNA helicase
MPALIRTERIVAMSEKQRYSYLEMVSRHLVELGEDIVTAKDAGARVMKLQQILNGYIKNEDGIVEIDPDAPIYGALLDEVAGTLPGKSIVWCRYREDIRRACAVLRKNKFKVLEFHGGVPLGKREGIRVAFNTDPEWTVLVGQPGAGGEGRDFSEADAIIFFSSTPNAIHVAQAEERGTVKGGSSTTIVRIRTPGTVDDRNWQIADGKVTLADTVSGRGLRDLLMQTNV